MDVLKIKKDLNSGVYPSEIILKYVKEWLDENIQSNGLGYEAKQDSKYLKYWILEWESLIQKIDHQRATSEIDFTNDWEKMRDFHKLSKEEFLESYSYLDEKEYQATANIVNGAN